MIFTVEKCDLQILDDDYKNQNGNLKIKKL